MAFDVGSLTAMLVSRAPGGAGGNVNQGRHRNSQNSSVSAFLSTLIPIFLLASVLFVVFLLLRKRYPRIYQPRTFIGTLRDWQRSPQHGAGLFGWTKEYRRLKDEFVMGHAGLDNYLWTRFLRMLAAMCFVGCLITWPILFPVNATGGGDSSGLDILSFSHVTPGVRYYAQVFVSWIFLGWVMFLITRETRFFVRLRQHYYLSPYQSSLISSRTVLFTNVPEDARSHERFEKEFGHVKSAWFVDVSDELVDQVDDRDAAATQLEQGEVKLIRNYVKRMRKEDKRADDKTANREMHITVSESDRPTHRLKKLKVLPIGKKVDTIEWSRGELRHLIPEISQAQLKLKDNPAHFQGACFIEFTTVEAAHDALQKCGMKNKVSLTPKEYAPSPDTVIWKNIRMPFWKVQAFNVVCSAFVAFLCIFWSIPVAVIGAISNINALTNKVPFLSFIDNIPDVILGVVTGLLPVLLLAVLMALVPILCNFLAKLFEPTQGSVQMKVQSWVFPFQVIQVFLVTTFSSGAAKVATQIVVDPASAPRLLAQNLPTASNFYISYFILFGLLQAMLQLLNAVPLLMILILSRLLDKTPRKLYNRWVSLAGLGWGSLYAKFANLGVIALSYSCIAPLVLGFAAVGFTLLYLAFRYNALFVLGTQVSTRGNSYARALHQMTTGIYLAEVCLIGLFAIGTASTTQAIGPLVLEVIFLIATVGWHIWLNISTNKLEADLPIIQMPFKLQSGEVNNGDLEKSGDVRPSVESSNVAHEKAPPLNGREHRTGMMARVKGFLHPDTSAMNAAWLIASCINTPKSSYTDEEHDESFAHPATISECPTIWIAKDKYGLSKQEIAATKESIGHGIVVSDEAAWVDDKGKVRWTEDARTAPIWEEPVAY